MRQFLLQQPAFQHLRSGGASSRTLGHDYEQLLAAALREANQKVHEASRIGLTHKHMGCTAEVVYIDGWQVIVGHVGDSRTYHLHRGKLVQLTSDQTWVNRMMQLGALTPQEAENHPRRSEIQQAIGGHATLDPDLHHARLAPGDWILVCSDGLSSQINSEDLRALLQASPSAESAARRLINVANLRGAIDNVTVVVVKAT
jgi:protein phosphatase